MTVKDSHSAPSSGIFKPTKLVQTLSPYVLILFFYLYHDKLVKKLI